MYLHSKAPRGRATASADFGARLGRRAARRAGAVLTAELVLVLPLVISLVLAVIEFSLLWASTHRLSAAARAACRAATLPGSDDQIESEVETALAQTLQDSRLIEACQAYVVRGRHSGEPVSVELWVPMRAAAPDLLVMIGLGLGDRQLTARCVMPME
jgi:hypothetical protein